MPRLYAAWLRVSPFVPYLITALLLGLGLWAVRELTSEVQPVKVLHFMRETPTYALLLAVLFTGLSFTALMGYDASGLRYLGVKVPWPRMALGSFAGYAFGQTVGMGLVTGGAVRMRVYRGHGLTAAGVAKLMAFVSTGFGLGIAGVAAIAVFLRGQEAQAVLPFPVSVLYLLAGLGVLTVYLVLRACWRGQPLRLLGHSFPLPSFGLASMQLVFSALDILFASLVLWSLLPHAGLDFATFVAFYAIALALAILSHVPGGVGVFDAIMLYAYRGILPAESVLGALVLFRAIYYLAPLLIALVLLAINELRDWRQACTR